MKKIYLLLLTIPFLLTSCLFDDKDKFDDPASERMRVTLNEIREVLESAPNGWELGIFPNVGQLYGGYNLFLAFSDGSKVVAASERGAASETIESMYALVGDNGPVLSFNTYNKFIHYYSEPQKKGGLGTDDAGLGGDYEFMVVKATPEKITLMGKKTRNTMYMTPIASTLKWGDYMGEIKDAVKAMTFKKYKYYVGEDTIPVTAKNRNLSFNLKEGDPVIAPYLQTTSGYKLYSPIEIEGITVEEFVYQPTEKLFVPIDGASAELVPD